MLERRASSSRTFNHIKWVSSRKHLRKQPYTHTGNGTFRSGRIRTLASPVLALCTSISEAALLGRAASFQESASSHAHSKACVVLFPYTRAARTRREVHVEAYDWWMMHVCLSHVNHTHLSAVRHVIFNKTLRTLISRVRDEHFVIGYRAAPPFSGRYGFFSYHIYVFLRHPIVELCVQKF